MGEEGSATDNGKKPRGEDRERTNRLEQRDKRGIAMENIYVLFSLTTCSHLQRIYSVYPTSGLEPLSNTSRIYSYLNPSISSVEREDTVGQRQFRTNEPQRLPP